MKKILFSLLVVIIALFSFIACNKDTQTTNNSDTFKIKKLSLSEVTTNLNMAAKTGDIIIGMAPQLLGTIPSCSPCPPNWTGCICAGRRCDIIAPPKESELERFIAENPDMSIFSVKKLDDKSIEMTVQFLDAITEQKMQSKDINDNYLFLKEDILIDENLRETLRLPQNSYFSNGSHQFQFSENAQLGSLIINIVNK